MVKAELDPCLSVGNSIARRKFQGTNLTTIYQLLILKLVKEPISQQQ